MGALLPSCSALAPELLCRHTDILLYLVPSAALAFLFWMLSNAHPVFFLFTAAGTFCHELAHLVVGLLAGAEPRKFTVIPRRTGRNWELGSVTFMNLRWYNAAPVALAPMLVLAVPFGVAWWRTGPGWTFGPLDLAIAFLLAPQFLSFWPSPVDWRLALRSWPYVIIIGAVGLLAAYYRSTLFQIVNP